MHPLGALDPEWKVGVLLSRSKLSRGAIEAAWQFDQDTVSQVFIYNGLYPGLKLPAACRQKSVMSSVITDVMESNGARCQNWTDKDVINPKTRGINWPVVGVYYLNFEDGEVAAECCHNPFEETVKISKRTPVDKGFSLEKNWSDHEAYVESDDVKHSLYDFWKKQKGGI